MAVTGAGTRTLLSVISRAPRGRGRLVDALVRRRVDDVRIRTASGLNLSLDFGDRLDRRYAVDAYEPALLAFCGATLAPGDVVIDGGGHHGYLALRMAQFVAPTGRVITVEADEDNISRLRANVALNDALRVEVVASVLGETVGPRPFVRVFAEGETGWGSVSIDAHEGTETVVVQGTTIDTLSGGGANPVRLVKLDVQGAEHEALLGAAATLARCRPIIAMETVDVWWGSSQLTTLADTRALLASYGYLERGLHRSGKLVEPDGGMFSMFVPLERG